MPALRSASGLILRSDLALAYACAVAAGAITLALVPEHTQRAVVLDASTNLANLRDHPLSVLVVSAFVVERLRGLWVLPLLALAYAAVQAWLGRLATLVAAAIGHVGATLFVAVVLASGIAHGALDPSVARAPDVGVSYGMACLSGLLAGRVPRSWLRWYLAGALVLWVVPLLASPDYTALGHATALVLGLALAVLVTRAVRAARLSQP
ncbi:MAG: rhomboid-like protein [Kineosporiaceae bacterium]